MFEFEKATYAVEVEGMMGKGTVRSEGKHSFAVKRVRRNLYTR